MTIETPITDPLPGEKRDMVRELAITRHRLRATRCQLRRCAEDLAQARRESEVR